MTVHNNSSAQNAYMQMNKASNSIADSMEKISSGNQINSASDNPAGLAITEKLTAQINCSTVASNNAQEGISLIQTAEGALNETQSILQSMRELVIKASNGTYEEDGVDIESITKEISALIEQIDTIANSTTYNNKSLIDGSLEGSNALVLQIGTSGNDYDKITLSIGSATAESLGLNGSFDLSSEDGINKFLETIDNAINTVSSTRGDLGATQNRLDYVVSGLGNTIENFTEANDRMKLVDIAKEMKKLTEQNLLLQVSQAMYAQANQDAQMVLKLLD